MKLLDRINDFANNRAFGMNEDMVLSTKSKFWSYIFFLTHDLDYFGFWNEVRWRILG